MTSDELISLGATSTNWTNPEIELTPREIAETLLPDMTTVHMSDEEIDRFMRG